MIDRCNNRLDRVELDRVERLVIKVEGMINTIEERGTRIEYRSKKMTVAFWGFALAIVLVHIIALALLAIDATSKCQ